MKKHCLNTSIVYALLALLGASPAIQAGPPDPNNAALLYYQAFICQPKGTDQEREMVDNLADRADPNDWVRQYMRQCQPAINLAVAASQIQACDWGLRYSQGTQVPMPHLAQMRPLVRLIKTDAAVLVADKQYRQALERCLTIRRMAQHVGDQTVISFMVSTAINALADKAIQNTLEAMPPDEKILVWFKQELAVVLSKGLQIKNAIKGEEKFCLGEKGLDKDMLVEAAKESQGISPDQVEQLRTADIAFLDASLRYRTTHYQSALAILEGTDPYPKKLSQLETLEKKPESDAKQNPHALLAVIMGKPYVRLLTLDMRARSNDNLLKTAVEVYLVKARTGSIPDQLPPGMPKDPFNGQDFKYEKTQEGFILTRWTDDPAKDKTYRFAFKVR